MLIKPDASLTSDTVVNVPHPGRITAPVNENPNTVELAVET